MKGRCPKARLSWFKIGAVFALVATCASLPTSGPLEAQQSSTADLQQILQERAAGGDAQTTNASGQNAGPIELRPDNFSSVSLAPSRLEQIMSARANTKLTQFGYRDLGSARTVTVPQAGAVQDSYILGSGDELAVSLRGQENAEYRVLVNRNGQVVLPKLNPISAAGRTLGDFRDDLRRAVRSAYISTQAFASISQIRQITVVVSGEVQSPGQRLVTGLSSVADAILLSGGVKKTGSLRNIKLLRNGVERTIDLYGILTQSGAASVINLAAGDRIIVPPLGRTVAISGWVRRPGIYELSAGSSAITVQSLLRLAGGLETSGSYRLSVLRVERDGQLGLTPLAGARGTVRDGELMTVQPQTQQVTSRATLSGGTPLAGGYAVSGGMTKLSAVINAPGALGPNPYTLFGLIVRRNPITQIRTLVPFAPVAVLQGRQDMELQSGDVIRVFTTNEFRLVAAVLEAFRDAGAEARAVLRDPLDYPPSNPSLTADTEREEIALLSTKTLGEGGVLSDRLPTNELPPFGLTPPQQAYISGKLNNAGSLQQQQPRSNPNIAQNQSVHSRLGAYPEDLYPSSYPYPNPKSVTANIQNSPQGNQQIQTDVAQPSQAELEASLPANLQEQRVTIGEVPSNTEVQTFGQLSRQLNLDALVLVHFLADDSAIVGGKLHGAGSYLVGPGVTLQDLIAAAGGLDNWTDTSHVEIISTSILPAVGKSETHRQLVSLNDPAVANYVVKPHDEVRFSQIYASVGAGAVTIQGQVRDTGTFNIERGERLSELLLRAGGLTDEAYPFGTIFLRKSAAATERAGYRRTADEIQNVLIAGTTRVGNEKISPEAFTSMQAFVTELRNTPALGRISVIADPALLASHPSRDPMLEPGDVIYIPQRPSSVTVLGQVMQPGSFLFNSKTSAEDYIAMAGGYGQFADESLTFVVLPDGTARQISPSWLNFDDPNIPPGSTIVVPRDMAPIDLRQTILDITGILSQLAISAASLSVINNHN